MKHKSEDAIRAQVDKRWQDLISYLEQILKEAYKQAYESQGMKVFEQGELPININWFTFDGAVMPDVCCK